MRAAWAWGRSRWAPTRRRLAALALLVGLALGATLTAGAAARRTETALDRFTEVYRGQDATWVILDGPAPPEAAADLPMVEAFAPFRGVIGDVGLDREVFLTGPADERFGRDVQRPRLVTGRLPHPDAVDELVLEEGGAAEVGAIGDRLRVRLASAEDWRSMLAGEEGFGHFSGPTVDMRVVGIIRTGDDIEEEAGSGPGARVSRAFVEAYDDLGGLRGAMVRLHGGEADLADFEGAVRRLLPAETPHYVFPGAADLQGASDAAGILGTGLWILTAIAGVAAALALGLVVWRLTSGERASLSVLRSLGARRHEVAAAAIVAAASALLGGAVLAVALAVVASPLGPMGVARRAEPHPGVALHLAIVPAAVVLVGLLLLATGVAGWRAARPPATVRRPERSGPGRWSGALGPSAAIGVRLGIGTRWARSWATALGVAASVVGLAAAAVFTTSLDRLADTPERWGWPADAILEIRGDDLERARAELGEDDRIAALADGSVGFVVLGDQQTATYSIDPIRGPWSFTVTDGREPRSPDEVLLGADTMDRLGAEVGDTVEALAAGAEPGSELVPLRVVGRGVFPDVDNDPTDAAGMTPTGYAAVRQLDTAAGGTTLWVRFADGVDHDAMGSELADRFEGSLARGLPVPPTQVRHLERVSAVPWSIAVFLGLLGAAVLAYALVTRSRHADVSLGTLRALGFRPRQVRACVRWQAASLAVAALVIGLPLGVVAGRVTWSLTAESQGVATDPVVPAGLLVLTVALLAAASTVIAELPARQAARRAAPAIRPSE